MSEPTKITDHLWLGGALPLGISLHGRRPIVVDLPPEGVDVVVSLRTEYQNVMPGGVGDLGPVLANMHFPLDDHPDATPTAEWLRAVVDCVIAWTDIGKVVLVHCAAGISRSGMVAVAYLMDRHQMTYDQAMNEVCGKRPQVCPNAGFAKLLKGW